MNARPERSKESVMAFYGLMLNQGNRAASVRKYVVVNAVGARTSPERGDYILAYALPKRQ